MKIGAAADIECGRAPKKSGPLDIAALSDVWIRGGDASATYMALDGSNNATSWTDLSGHGNNATIASGGPNANVAAVRNGHRGLRGNGASARLNFAGVTMNATNTFVLVASRGTTLAGLVSWTGSLGLLANHTFQYEWFDGDIQSFSNSATGPHIWTATQTDGANLTLYFDGTQVFSGVPSGALNARQILTLFCRTGGDLFTDADIFEFIHARSVLSAPTLSSLHSTLKTFYSL